VVNDIEGIDNAILPAVRFYPKNNKTPILYQGEYTKDKIVAWAKEHSTVDWSGYKVTSN